MTDFVKTKDIKSNWLLIDATDAIVGRLAVFISNTISRRSMPAANPIAGVDGPPICSTKKSYLPPPHSAFCDWSLCVVISSSGSVLGGAVKTKRNARF